MKSDLLIELLLAFSEKTISQKICVLKGTTVGELKKRTDLNPRIKTALTETKKFAINGKIVADNYEIKNFERLIVLRPLVMDPKEMRRKRCSKL